MPNFEWLPYNICSRQVHAAGRYVRRKIAEGKAPGCYGIYKYMMNMRTATMFEWYPPNLTYTQKESAKRWISRRISRGLPIGCYGIYRHIASINTPSNLVKVINDKRTNEFAKKYIDRKSYDNWRIWCLRNKVDAPYLEYMEAKTRNDKKALKEKYKGIYTSKRRPKKAVTSHKKSLKEKSSSSCKRPSRGAMHKKLHKNRLEDVEIARLVAANVTKFK